MPELAGRLKGYAVRVLVPTGSLVDLAVEIERPTTVDEINAVFRGRADAGELEGILAYSETAAGNHWRWIRGCADPLPAPSGGHSRQATRRRFR